MRGNLPSSGALGEFKRRGRGTIPAPATVSVFF